MFRMQRIEVPSWARRPDVWLHGMRLSDYHAIQQHRDRLLDAVHQEVELYLNANDLCFVADEDGFPNRSKMSGEYYIGSESYAAQAGLIWYQISVACRCLEKPVRTHQSDFDYLQLEVWLRCDPADWSFTVFRNTDSSSI
jgi:hypothetical protein